MLLMLITLTGVSCLVNPPFPIHVLLPHVKTLPKESKAAKLVAVPLISTILLSFGTFTARLAIDEGLLPFPNPPLVFEPVVHTVPSRNNMAMFPRLIATLTAVLIPRAFRGKDVKVV